MAEATTVMDPAAAGQGDEPATQVSTIPTSGPMAVLYRVTGGQSLRQVLPAVAGILGAAAGTYGCAFLRAWLAARLDSDFRAALAEDALAICGSLAVLVWLV